MKNGIVLRGDLIWTEGPDRFRYIEGGYLSMEGGIIKGVSAKPPREGTILDYSGSLIIPGLSDLHLHAPQYSYAGLFMDEELLEWLEHHTFPEEARFADTGYAAKAYGAFVSDLTKGSTTRFSAFATIHRESSLLLMRLLEDAGLSGYVGKVSMDRNSPEELSEDTHEAIEEEIRFIDEASSFSRVRPIVTPRFIPSCSDELMEALGKIAGERDLPLQSHLDENPSEVEWVRALCPWADSYASAYGRFSALGPRTIMAHCVWPTEKEIGLLASTGTYVAHSPSSNGNLSSGIAPVRAFLEEGVNVGLATDVAGGSSLSMFRMITDSIQVSKLRWRLVDDTRKPLRFPEAFYLASKGGGSFFGKVGSFEPGYDADILVIDDWKGSTVLRSELSVPERLEFYAYRHPEEFISAKFVKGRRII